MQNQMIMHLNKISKVTNLNRQMTLYLLMVIWLMVMVMEMNPNYVGLHPMSGHTSLGLGLVK